VGAPPLPLICPLPARIRPIPTTICAIRHRSAPAAYGSAPPRPARRNPPCYSRHKKGCAPCIYILLPPISAATTVVNAGRPAPA
jgi:hypothetical protein